jgi:hypothetical protein
LCAWVRYLGRDPRAAFTAQQAQPPYAAVIMHGRADISAASAAAPTPAPTSAPPTPGSSR